MTVLLLKLPEFLPKWLVITPADLIHYEHSEWVQKSDPGMNLNRFDLIIQY